MVQIDAMAVRHLRPDFIDDPKKPSYGCRDK